MALLVLAAGKIRVKTKAYPYRIMTSFCRIFNCSSSSQMRHRSKRTYNQFINSQNTQ
jgi:hypothetical protein